jgi:thymidylate synthase
LNQEIERVINNPELKDIFETIDKDISANSELKAFRKVIDENNDLLIKLENYSEFKKEVWISYLFQIKEDTTKLIDLYDSKIDTIKDIIEEAKTSRTARQEAVDEFNTRFINMPFTLYIDNKEDIMLKMDHPVIKFKFIDSD